MNGRILIVDDEPDFFERLTQELEALKYKVEIRSSVAEARVCINENHEPFDLILVDWLFDQEEGGLLLVNGIRSMEEEYITKIIIVTKDDSHSVVIKAFKDLKVDDFFSKQAYHLPNWVTTIQKLIKPRLKKVIAKSRDMVITDSLLEASELMINTLEALGMKEVKTEFELLKSRIGALEGEKNNGTISSQEYDANRTQLRKNFLDLLNELD